MLNNLPSFGAFLSNNRRIAFQVFIALSATLRIVLVILTKLLPLEGFVSLSHISENLITRFQKSELPLQNQVIYGNNLE